MAGLVSKIALHQTLDSLLIQLRVYWLRIGEGLLLNCHTELPDCLWIGHSHLFHDVVTHRISGV